MNRTEIRLLQCVSESPGRQVQDLAEELELSRRTVERSAKNLKEKGLVTVDGGLLSLPATAKSALLRRLSRGMQVYKLLLDSGEKILPELLGPRNLVEISRSTKLSLPTVARTLNRMREAGAIERDSEGRFSIDQRYPDLRLLASLFKEEESSKLTRDQKGEILYRDRDSLITRIQKGQIVPNGSLTAFSMFESFGMHLRTELDYYIIPSRNITPVDVFVHALVVSENKLERTHCAVFYALNRERMDVAEIRRECEGYGVSRVWIDLEAYVQGTRSDLFLPWSEFAERCKLYDLDPRVLVPKKTYPRFFEALGHILPRETSLYLIGEENMRIKGMKQATNDIDFVLRGGKKEIDALFDSLKELHYTRLGKSELTRSDAELNPSGVFSHKEHPRVDVFSNIICNKFLLLNSMIKDSRQIKFEKLVILLACDEDVFLLKSITDREADDVDMIQILRKSSDFNWRRVLDRLYEQEQVTKRHCCFGLFDAIEFIQNSSGMKIPIYRELLNHTLDEAISKVLKKFGQLGVKEILENVGNVKEYEVRNRLQRLVSDGAVKKGKMDGRLVFSLSR